MCSRVRNVQLRATFLPPANDGRLSVSAVVDAPQLNLFGTVIDAVRDLTAPSLLLKTESLSNLGEPVFQRVEDVVQFCWMPHIPDAKDVLRDTEEAGLFYQRGNGPEQPVLGLEDGVIQMVELKSGGYKMTTKANRQNRFFLCVMEDANYTVPSWSKASPYPTGICEGNHAVLLSGVQAGDRLIVRLKRVPSVAAEVVVVKVKITSPKGSAHYKPPIPGSFVDAAPPYRYDWQGIVSGARGSYSLTISGEIGPNTFGYRWTLDAPCGSLTAADTPTPTHAPPADTGAGSPEYVECHLRLEAMQGATPTKARSSRWVRVYKDHLARDMANFLNAGVADVRNFKMPGGTQQLSFDCHVSTKHANRGEIGCAPPNQPQFWDIAQPKKVVQVVHTPTGGGTHPALGPLNRGDVIAYYGANGLLMHSQTATGNGTETFGANNIPLTFPGLDQNQSWKWATSPAGDWANKVMQGLQIVFADGTVLQIAPVVIAVFDKP
jgi:hypothetical protein